MPRRRLTKVSRLTLFDQGDPAWVCLEEGRDFDHESELEVQQHHAAEHSPISLISDYVWLLEDEKSHINEAFATSLQQQVKDSAGTMSLCGGPSRYSACDTNRRLAHYG